MFGIINFSRGSFQNKILAVPNSQGFLIAPVFLTLKTIVNKLYNCTSLKSIHVQFTNVCRQLQGLDQHRRTKHFALCINAVDHRVSFLSPTA